MKRNRTPWHSFRSWMEVPKSPMRSSMTTTESVACLLWNGYRDCCAVAKFKKLDNETISTKTSVHLVSLANESHAEHYHKNIFFELPQQTSIADMLFFLLSATKLWIALDGKMLSTQVSNGFFPVNEQLTKALGLTERNQQIRYVLMATTKISDIPIYLLFDYLGEK